MSKYINVNPDHYKVAGRERPSTLAASRRRPTVKPDFRAKERRERTTAKLKTGR
jgi:hypothetical protein